MRGAGRLDEDEEEEGVVVGEWSGEERGSRVRATEGTISGYIPEMFYWSLGAMEPVCPARLGSLRQAACWVFSKARPCWTVGGGRAGRVDVDGHVDVGSREGLVPFPIYPHLTVWPAFRTRDLAGLWGLCAVSCLVAATIMMFEG